MLIFCIAFIIGGYASGWGWMGWLGIASLSLTLAVAVPLLVNNSPKRWIWLVAGLVALTASFYVQFRTPLPQSNDISKFADRLKVTVRGAIADTITATRSGRARFLLDAQEVEIQKGKSEPVSGSIYVTTPLTQATGLRPGQRVELKGTIYEPGTAQNPGGFDFKLYLARQGVFAGFTARNITALEAAPKFGGWWVRSRMVKAHVLGLGVPEGTLLSSLVLGNRAVDLPTDLKDTFVRVGLAAALAASGFQVSLILGAVLLVCRTWSPIQQFSIGMTSLFLFLVLTGVSPSVLRAVVMGTGLLIGELVGRKPRPLAGLAIAAVILLIYQPLWIYDLGFQFSFLATFGLLVSARPIEQRLNRLPPLLAAALAIPSAAYIWTLPVQLYAFGKVSPYSIFANVLTTPLVSLATVAGICSGVLGVIFIPLGALASWLLLAPIVLLIAIATWIGTLPGSAASAGTISIWQLGISYGLLILITAVPWWQKRWLPAIFLAALVLFVPGIYAREQIFRATVLAADDIPIMLIQNQNVNTLINSGKKQTAQYTLLPLFQKEGINQIDWAIVTDPQPDISDGWRGITANGLGIKNLLDLGTSGAFANFQSLLKQLATGGTKVSSLILESAIAPNPNFKIELLNSAPLLLKLTMGEVNWLFLGNAEAKIQEQLLAKPNLIAKLPAKILWWNGKEILPQLLQVIKPQVAIASANFMPDDTIAQMQEADVQLYWTGRDGAVQWTPNNQIQALKEIEDTRSPL